MKYTHRILSSTGGLPPYIPDDSDKTNGNEPYLNFMEFFLNQNPIPQVLSTSYGDDEQTVRYVSQAWSFRNVTCRPGPS